MRSSSKNRQIQIQAGDLRKWWLGGFLMPQTTTDRFRNAQIFRAFCNLDDQSESCISQIQAACFRRLQAITPVAPPASNPITTVEGSDTTVLPTLIAALATEL